MLVEEALIASLLGAWSRIGLLRRHLFEGFLGEEALGFGQRWLRCVLEEETRS